MDEARLKFFLERYPFREVPSNKPGEITSQFVTCPARLAFAFLDKPRQQQSGKEAFTASLIIPPAASLEVPQRIYAGVAAQRFGPSWQSMQLKSPVKPQAKCQGKYDGFAETGVYLDCSSKFRPPVFDQNKMQLSTAPGQGVYSGMWVLAWLRVYTYPVPGAPNANTISPGVGFGIVSLQKLCDDEEFKGADKSGAFDVVAHDPVAATAPAPSGPAQPPTLPGWA